MSSAYLDTRISLFAGRLWRADAFGALLDAAPAEVPALLTARGLPQLAQGYAGQDPLSLEQRIIARMLDETRVLLRPLAGPARDFLLHWTERFEVTNLKTLVRGKLTGERPAALIARLTPMGGFARLDVEDLAHAEDVMELLRRLETGPYAGIVRQARLAFEDGHDPFMLDAALDRGYYEGLVERARPLEAAHGAAFHALMAGLIDRVNLVWLLRYRFNYRLPPAQVYYLLVASRYRLPAARLKALAAQDSPAAVLAALPEPLARMAAGAADIPELAERLDAAAANAAARALRAGAPAIARAFAYLMLRERDLRAVRAILRGRHLGLPEPAIRQALGSAMGAA